MNIWISCSLHNISGLLATGICVGQEQIQPLCCEERAEREDEELDLPVDLCLLPHELGLMTKSKRLQIQVEELWWMDWSLKHLQ